MLTLTNKTTRTTHADEDFSCVVTRWDAEGFAQCNGSSIDFAEEEGFASDACAHNIIEEAFEALS